MTTIVLVISGFSCLIWLFLLTFWGGFWQATVGLSLTESLSHSQELPRVWAIVPARNEAELLPQTLSSLLQQDYQGTLTIVLVDDHSTDGTAQVAQTVATQCHSDRLQVLSGEPLPQGWTGKLWAMAQGVQAATNADYFLFTDADIYHEPHHVQQLIDRAQQEDRALVSEMVRLRCESLWEKLLIPAFVYFFQMLYPFNWVNNPTHPIAAAAGGCILIRADYLVKIGGLEVIRQALIDDCALAAAVKKQGGSLWLGLTSTTLSLRPYASLGSIWDMVARTAYTQLQYSPWLLIGTVVGLGITFLVPPLATLWGIPIGLIGLVTWLIMAVSYVPTLRLYKQSPWFALFLPAIACLYLLMTIDSAWRHWQGRGGSWKGRNYVSSVNFINPENS